MLGARTGAVGVILRCTGAITGAFDNVHVGKVKPCRGGVWRLCRNQTLAGEPRRVELGDREGSSALTVMWWGKGREGSCREAQASLLTATHIPHPHSSLTMH